MICWQLFGVGTVVCSALGLLLVFRYVEGNLYSFWTEALVVIVTFWDDLDFVSFFFDLVACFDLV